jgi:site-specific recombinase XerD
MITFKPVIRTSQVRQDGNVNIKIRVSNNRVLGYIATKYYIYPKEMDKESGRLNVQYRNPKEVNDINMSLLEIVGQYATRIRNSKERVEKLPMSMLLKFLREKGDPTDLFTLLDKTIKTLDQEGNVNYRDAYKGTKVKLETFTGSSVLPFEIITSAWLEKFDSWMKTTGGKQDSLGKFLGLSPNSIGVHMRNVKTLYNQAITDGIADISTNPFRRYKIPKAATRKRNLSALEIATIYRVEIKDPLMAWARDMFMLSFFLIGINMKDLFLLSKIEDGRIFYIRSKGKKPYSIKVHPEAQEIISRYPGSKYLLNTMDRYVDYRSATKRVNYKLKDIGKLCKIEKEITTYWCRHSWATIGRSLKIAKDDISLGLGHQRPNLEITEIYIDDEQEIIDIANRQIIDHILQIKIPLSK